MDPEQIDIESNPSMAHGESVPVIDDVPFSIDFRSRDSDLQATDHGVDAAFNVSGFVMRGFYYGRWNSDRTKWAVKLSPGEPLEPFAQSEATAEVRGRRSRLDLTQSSERWRTSAQEQKEPYRKYYEPPSRNALYERVPNLFSAPRMMPLQPMYTVATHPQEDMQRWINTCVNRSILTLNNVRSPLSSLLFGPAELVSSNSRHCSIRPLATAQTRYCE